MESPAPIVAIIGPEGEGKTYTGLAAAIYHAERRMQGKPLHGAIIRDTFENIKNKTRDSITKAVQTIAYENDDPAYLGAWRWKDGGRQLHGPHGIHFNLFGANDLGDLTKLQGADMWSFIWIEEPAPMYLGNNAGVPREVFDACVSRAARGGSAMRLQITMNPADEEHWTFDVLKKNPIMRPDETPDIYTEVFHIPYGDNPARTDLMRQATKAAYKDDPALYARLVLGKFAFVQIGEKVTPEYNEEHRSREPLQVLKNCKSFRFYDGGLNPTCVIGQISPSGQIRILRTFRGIHCGMEQELDAEVIPYLSEHFKDAKVPEWLDIGDPSLETPEQSDSTHCAARTIESKLKRFGCRGFIPGVVHWRPRLNALGEALNKSISGRKWIVLDPLDLVLHQSLRGGWHYKKTVGGQILRDKPVKDLHSHPGDAFSYGIAELLGYGAATDETEATNDVSFMTTSMSGRMGI